MALTHEPAGPKIIEKIKIYILSRAKLLCSLCHEIHCRSLFKYCLIMLHCTEMILVTIKTKFLYWIILVLSFTTLKFIVKLFIAGWHTSLWMITKVLFKHTIDYSFSVALFCHIIRGNRIFFSYCFSLSPPQTGATEKT